MNISVLYNKPTQRFSDTSKNVEAEEDTQESAEEVLEALEKKKYHATLVPITEDTIPETVALLSTSDLVFNLIEWTGVDAHFAADVYDLFAKKKIKFTGATKESYFLSCDKVAMKKRLDKGGFATARWQAFETGDEPIRDDLIFPVIVKVSLEHSSVGLSKEAIIEDPDKLQKFVKKQIHKFKQPVLAEQFLTGREFQVTLLDTKKGLVVLPPSEVVYYKGTDVPFLTYESRWNADHPDFDNSTVVIAKLSPEMTKEIEEMSKQVFISMGYRDYARFDVRCLGDQPMFLEVNSNPGLSDDPQYGMTVSYKSVGMTFADVIEEIVESARRRYGM